MIKKLAFLLCFFTNFVFSQNLEFTIIVKDFDTDMPVEEVTITALKTRQGFLTNKDGKAIISLTRSSDLEFIHSSYKTLVVKFSTLDKKENAFDHPEIKEALDLCLSCKGCTAECPSNVDVAKLKMEFLYQYQKEKGLPLRSWLVGNFAKLSNIASNVPFLYNFVMGTPAIRRISNALVGFHPDRTMPLMAKQTLWSWLKSRTSPVQAKSLYLFVVEFTNFNDA